MKFGLDQLDAVLHAVSEPTATLDRSGRILTHNPRLARVFGYDHAELNGVSFGSLLPASSRERQLETLSAFFDEPDPALSGIDHLSVGLRKSGTEFPLEVRLSAPTDVEGQTVVIASLRDVTERESLRENYRKAQRMESVGQFASGLSHDFNNLLTVILCSCRMLSENLLHSDAESRELVAEIQSAATQATELTRQILSNSKRAPATNESGLNANGLVRRMSNTLERLVGEAVTLETQLDESVGTIPVDTSMLERVLLNLTGNARDAMPDGGQLTIETNRVDHAEPNTEETVAFLRLRVTDNGIGMTPEVSARAFDPFFTTKDDGLGTGLGLVLVRTVVESAGGFIETTSQPGRGTRFDLFFPCSNGEKPVMLTTPEPQRSSKDRRTVLLVEDSDETLSIMTRALEAGGFEVLQASHPNDAIRFAAQRAVPIDAFIVDVVLPLLDGPKLVQRLLPSQPKARVLFISGYDEALLRERGAYDLGEVLMKPFEPQELLTQLESLLSDGAQSKT